MEIRHAAPGDLDALLAEDRWITPEELLRKIEAGQVLVLDEPDGLAGLLRWGLFWDNTPFMNLLRVKEPYRGQGLGSRLVLFWEQEMKAHGYRSAMTSTAWSETAQQFYQKLGYTASGGFTPPNEPFELILFKPL